MSKCAVLFTLAAFLAACAPAPAPEAVTRAERDPAVVRGSIDQLRAAYKAAVEAGDSAAVAALYAEDAVLIPVQGGRYVGRETIQGSYQALFDQGKIVFNAEPRSFEMSGDLAVEDGAVTFSLTPEGGQPQDIHVDYLVVAKEIDGAWQIIRLESKPAPETP